jgi:hypothetical protein
MLSKKNIPFYFLEAEFRFISLGELIIEICSMWHIVPTYLWGYKRPREIFDVALCGSVEEVVGEMVANFI